MARASATRFFIPPLSSAGYRSSTPERPTLARQSATSSWEILVHELQSAQRSQGYLDAVFGHARVLVQQKPHVFAHRQAVEKGAALKDEADLQVLLRDVLVGHQAHARLALDDHLALCLDWHVHARHDRHTLSGATRPAMRRSVVDLPVPEPPMMPTASPRRILKLTPRSTSLEPKDLCTSRSSMTTSSSLSVEGRGTGAVTGLTPLAGVVGFLAGSSCARCTGCAAGSLRPPRAHLEGLGGAGCPPLHHPSSFTWQVCTNHCAFRCQKRHGGAQLTRARKVLGKHRVVVVCGYATVSTTTAWELVVQCSVASCMAGSAQRHGGCHAALVYKRWEASADSDT